MSKNSSISSKFQLPRARNFPREETDSANHACLTKQSESNCPSILGQAQNSNCLEQEFSITREDRECKPCMPNKTIRLIKNMCTSLKFQLPRSKIFSAYHTCLTKHSAIQVFKHSWTSSKVQLPRARNFPRKGTDSANHACHTKQSAIQLSKNSWTSSKFQLPSARNFPRKETDSANHACLTKQSAIQVSKNAQNSNCFEQEFSITRENRQCKPCVPNKTIRLIKTMWTSSKVELPRSKFFSRNILLSKCSSGK